MKLATRKGFTLIEILIVVIILGILAAIVIPQFTNASDDAKKSAAASLVQTIRSQIELYKLEYGAKPSKLSTDWGELTKQGTSPLDATKKLGPYLQESPKNPLQTSTNAGKVKDVTTDAAAADGKDVGFVYDTNTGRIWISDGSADGGIYK